MTRVRVYSDERTTRMMDDSDEGRRPGYNRVCRACMCVYVRTRVHVRVRVCVCVCVCVCVL